MGDEMTINENLIAPFVDAIENSKVPMSSPLANVCVFVYYCIVSRQTILGLFSLPPADLHSFLGT